MNSRSLSAVFILFLVFSFCQIPLAIGVGLTQAAANDWFRYYYFHKDNKDIVGAMELLFTGERQYSERKLSSLTAFFATIFQQHSDKAYGWINATRLNESEKRPLIMALWYAGLGQQARRLAKRGDWNEAALAKLAKSPPSLENLPIKEPTDLAMMWGAFKASGDTRYVMRVIDVLDRPETDNIDDLATPMIKGMAERTLKTHSRRYQSVRQICEAEMARRRGVTKTLLEDILSDDTIDADDEGC